MQAYFVYGLLYQITFSSFLLQDFYDLLTILAKYVSACYYDAFEILKRDNIILRPTWNIQYV